MIKTESFGATKNGEQVTRYVLSNTSGMTVTVMDYGAYITGIRVPDRDGNIEDVTLGYATLREYEENDGYLGACVGRFANRIAGAHFSLNDREFTLDANNGVNTLHGGFSGYNKRMWDAELDKNADSVTFHLVSPDMDQGFPGELDFSVTYTLTEDNALRLDYRAVCNQDTPLNLTNHSYFNLSGKQGSQSVLDHSVKLNTPYYTPVSSAASIPTGEIAPVDGTPMDFLTAKKLGRDIGADFDQLRYGGGYDHNWMFSGYSGELRELAVLSDEESGRSMTVYTDLPGVQMYTGNFLNGSHMDKLGKPIAKRSGVCFETQFPPDSVNQPDFPSPVIRAGQMFHSTTVYTFSVKM